MPTEKVGGKTQRNSMTHRTVISTFIRCPNPPLWKKEKSVKGVAGEKELLPGKFLGFGLWS